MFWRSFDEVLDYKRVKEDENWTKNLLGIEMGLQALGFSVFTFDMVNSSPLYMVFYVKSRVLVIVVIFILSIISSLNWLKFLTSGIDTQTIQVRFLISSIRAKEQSSWENQFSFVIKTRFGCFRMTSIKLLQH